MRIETSWLDFKLGLRMLLKHPVLTVIGVVATTFAIGMSASYFEVSDFTSPALPLQDGARIITIQNDDLEAAASEPRSLHDFIRWRSDLKSVEDLGVFTIYSRNLRPKDASAEPIDVVEISAAAFRVARIAPLLGRSLADADEQIGAPPVVVIGERLWESRFIRDPNILGQFVELGSTSRTIVGVMPKTFALPMNQSIWVPFRFNALDYARREGPAIRTIGRLSPGVSLEEAQAELTVVGERIAAEFPQTHARLRPRIMPYLKAFAGDDLERQIKLGINGIFIMLLVVICGNLGALVFARIASRESELIVRTALGASRGRIIMQLFAEALVLTSVSAGAALAILSWGLRRAETFVLTVMDDTPPFWHNSDLSATTILYVGVLTLLAAIVTGILPALKFTRGGVETSLRRSAVGGSGMRSRKMSTAVIVTQVALSGAMLPIAMVLTFKLNWSDLVIPIRTEEYLTLRYRTEEPTVPSSQFAATYQRLKERLLHDGSFSSVTFSDQLPGSSNAGRLIEVNDPSVTDVHRVRSATIDVSFFDAMGAPILAGRGFHPGDRDVVIVNRPFVENVLGGRNPIGLQLRFTGAERDDAPSRWFEIVGVVPDLGMSPREPDEAKGIYHPAAAEQLPSGFMAMRVGRNPLGAAQKLRSIAAAVDPTLLIYDMLPLNDIGKTEKLLDQAFFVLVVGAIYFIVFLSAVVTFALMSFTVSQRTREIGIRKALGAGTRSILTSVFRRASIQLGLGAGLGAFLSLRAFSRIPDSHVAEPGMILGIMAFMIAVGFISCVAPALRVLRIEPTQALKED